MQVDVIFTTYNQRAWLEKTLWGFACQTHRDFRVIVADDGSTQDTREMIEQWRAEGPLHIEHVWQPDEGFRKCAILNKAIMQSDADYLIFTDGDCIPRADFVERHVSLARRGCFLSAGMTRLRRSVSEHITRNDVADGHAFNRRWLRAAGQPSHKLMRLSLGQGMGAMFDALTPTKRTFNGHNASAWRADVLGAGGFDERMGYFGLDVELGLRLGNAGVQPQQVRHRVITLHLDHDRDWVHADVVASNKAIMAETRRSGRTRTEHGLPTG